MLRQHNGCQLRWNYVDLKDICYAKRYSALCDRQLDCLFSRLFSILSKITPKFASLAFYKGNTPMTADFPHNGPVIQKLVLFDDTIITTAFICFFCSDSNWWYCDFARKYHRIVRFSSIDLVGIISITTWFAGKSLKRRKLNRRELFWSLVHMFMDMCNLCIFM